MFETGIDGDMLTFEGQIQDDKITGTFTQQGQAFPFELTRGNETVKKDLTEIEVPDGVMKGKVEIPEGEGPFPVAIIIAGSGPTDKDGNSTVMLRGSNHLKMIAEGLATAGIASIRYDKRGIGDNIHLGGKEEDLRFDDYIQDAVSWLAYAKDTELFSSVSVIGHSEGSLIGMAASNQAETDVFVSLAGSGRPVDALLRDQLKRQLPEDLFRESESILNSLRRGETVDNVSPELHNIFRPSVQPYMISWMKYHPEQELARINSPSLIINGTRDLQVPVSDAKRLHNAKSNADLLIVENMNHVLKEAPADQKENLATYSNPAIPLVDDLIDSMIVILKKKTT